MKKIIGACLLLVCSQGYAAPPSPAMPPPPSQSAPSQAAASGRAWVIFRPSLDAIQKALVASGLRSARPALMIDYDAKGVPTSVRLDPGSGNAGLDQAILDWGRALRLAPGQAGIGRMPFSLVNDDEGGIPQGRDPATFPEIKNEQFAVKPSMQPILRAVSAAGFDDANAVLVIAYDANGRVTEVQTVRSSGSIALDAAIIDWTEHLLLKPGAAGYGRLPFSFKAH